MRTRNVAGFALLCVFCGHASAAEELRHAVDRNGQRPVPVITARDHCAWPNLKLLKDGRTLTALIFNDPSHGHRPGDTSAGSAATVARRGSSAARRHSTSRTPSA